MSQITSTRQGGTPVPGAGITTITGNNGLPVPGDGGVPNNNVNIIGGDGINITGVPGASTLLVDSTAQYTVDTPAVVYPSNTGNLNIEGDVTTTSDHVRWPNIQTTAVSFNHPAGPNTVGIQLSSIVGVDDLYAVTSVFSAGTLTAVGRTWLRDSFRLEHFPSGAIVTDATGEVSAANGAAGTVLTANPGGAPSFQPVPGASGSTVSSFFARQIGDTGLITGNNTGAYVYLGANIALTTAGTDCFNTGANFTPGDGAGVPAEYIAHFNGTYFFNMQVAVYAPTGAIIDVSLLIRNATQNRNYYGANACQTGYILSASEYVAQFTYSTYIQLAALDVVRFGVNSTQPSVPSLIGITGSKAVANTSNTYTATTFVSGFKVA